MGKRRKNYSSQEKVALLKRHLLEGRPISDLCDENGLHPTVFHRWQKEFFENGSAAFETNKSRQSKADEKKILHLENKLQDKNEVLAELMGEYVKLKKELGVI